MKTNNNPHGIVVGQVLYSFYEGKSYRQVTVTGINRKYATCDGGWSTPRVSLDKLQSDRGERFFTSKNHYDIAVKEQEDAIETEKKWDKFRNHVSIRYKMPDGMTRERIEQATKILFPEQDGAA